MNHRYGLALAALLLLSFAAPAILRAASDVRRWRARRAFLKRATGR